MTLIEDHMLLLANLDAANEMIQRLVVMWDHPEWFNTTETLDAAKHLVSVPPDVVRRYAPHYDQRG